MHQDTYGFPAAEIHQLAAELARALEIDLHLQQSPLAGPWYSSEDLAAITKAIREGKEPIEPDRRLHLVLNDPEPGYRAPTFPGGGDCLLTVWAQADTLNGIEAALRDSDLPFRRLGRREC
jgi:hypothetical protein